MINLEILITKEFITFGELHEIEEHEEVTNVENCGCSGQHIGYNWYVVTVGNEEYNIYVK